LGILARHTFPTRRSSDLWWTCVGNHDYDYDTYDPPPSAAPPLTGMPGLDFVVDLGYVVVLSTFVRAGTGVWPTPYDPTWLDQTLDRKSTRLNSSHVSISY